MRKALYFAYIFAFMCLLHSLKNQVSYVLGFNILYNIWVDLNK